METNETLRIEHIAKRLPHGLKALVEKTSHDYEDVGSKDVDSIESVHTDGVTFLNSADWYFEPQYNDTDIKLILFPMKCIMENVIVDGEERCFYEFFGMSEPNEFTDFHKYTNEQWASVPIFSHEYEELLKFHFDVDNLIEKGLAISVFDLTENPYA